MNSHRPDRMRTWLAGAAAVALGLTLAPEIASAQWVDEEGSLSTSFSYQYARSDRIMESGGEAQDDFNITHQALLLAADYSLPVEGLQIGVSAPFFLVKWTEDNSIPHPPTRGEWDDGSWHFSPTDIRADLTYQVLSEPFAAAVSLGTSIPLWDYPRIGFTAPGRGLKQAHAGAAVGRSLDPWVPNLWATASYEFSLVERLDVSNETDDYGQNYSEFHIQSGYQVTDKLGFSLGFDKRIAHGGFDFVDWNMVSADIQMNHDAILRENFTLVGGGTQYSVTDTVTVVALFRLFVTGTNTRDAHQVSLGVGWHAL